MPLPDGLELRDATEADLPAIAGLREAVDWRVHAWALRLVLQPPGRCVVAVDGHDDVVGVGSGIAFGPIGVVGNMIVARAHRGRGVGSAILAGVIADLEARGCRVLELYATSDGRPLYARAGFVHDGPSIAATVPPSTPLADDIDTEVTEGDEEAIEELVAWDAERWGGDRRAVLVLAAADPTRPLLVARRGDGVAGYAWVRPEHGRLGPFVADDPPAAEAILAAARPRTPGPLLAFTVAHDNAAALAWLAAHGIEGAPWDGHMVRNGPLPRRGDTIWGSVVGALG